MNLLLLQTKISLECKTEVLIYEDEQRPIAIEKIWCLRPRLRFHFRQTGSRSHLSILKIKKLSRLTSSIQTINLKYLVRCKVVELQNSCSMLLQHSSNPHNHIGVDRQAVRMKILWLELRCTHGVLSQGT